MTQPVMDLINKSPKIKKDEFDEEIDSYFKDKLTKPIEIVPKKALYSFDNRKYLNNKSKLL